MGVYREQACGKMYDIARGWLKADTLEQIAAEQAGTAPPWYERVPDMLPRPWDASRPLMDAEGSALNHLEQARVQLRREPRAFPRMRLNPVVRDVFAFQYEDFTLEGYEPHPAIKAPIAV